MEAKSSEIEKFLTNPLYPGQFEISTKLVMEHALGLPLNMKKFYVNGNPVECTLECDYSVINVSGSYHRLYIIGIQNQINITGTFHSIYLEGFHNQVNFCTDVEQGLIFVQGDSPLAYTVGVSNGKINNDGETVPKPNKLPFPENLKEKRRRRLRWQPVPASGMSVNNGQEGGKGDCMFL